MCKRLIGQAGADDVSHILKLLAAVFVAFVGTCFIDGAALASEPPDSAGHGGDKSSFSYDETVTVVCAELACR